MVVRVDLIVSEAQAERWQELALAKGFYRANPDRPWTDDERKRAIRYAMGKVLKEVTAKIGREDVFMRPAMIAGEN
jgi:hypothetical protein